MTTTQLDELLDEAVYVYTYSELYGEDDRYEWDADNGPSDDEYMGDAYAEYLLSFSDDPSTGPNGWPI